MAPEVSVVIPTRGRPRALGQTLACVRWQRDVDLEVIVVEDGVTHGVDGVIAGLDGLSVRLVRVERRGGVSAARNRGIEEARGRWIAFLDDDDLWAPDKLRQQLEAMRDTGLAWAYAGDVNVDDDLRVLTGSPPPAPKDVLDAIGRYNPVPTGASNVVVRADALARAGRFDPALRRTEDWDMWIRLAQLGAPAWVRRPLVAYRFHRSNVPTETGSFIREPEVLARRYGIPVDRAAMHRRAAWATLRAGRRARAVRHYAGAVVRGDIRSLGRAVVAIAHPAVGSERLFRLLRSRPGDQEWKAEAQGWLDQLLETRTGGG